MPSRMHMVLLVRTQAFINEYAAGSDFLLSGATVKMQFWQVLPWLLAGMTHFDVNFARHIAARCLSGYIPGPS
jgi:hypothetical protein